MGDYEHKINRGSLFKNETKTGKQPDYRGEINNEGQLYWVSAWLEKSKAGKTYMSLSIQPKDEERAAIKNEPAAESDPDFDDSIPF